MVINQNMKSKIIVNIILSRAFRYDKKKSGPSESYLRLERFAKNILLTLAGEVVVMEKRDGN